MQWELLAKFMTYEELEEVTKIFGKVLREQARSKARAMPRLDKDERTLVEQGQWIQATKFYFRRQKCSLVMAKAAVDLYREKVKS